MGSSSFCALHARPPASRPFLRPGYAVIFAGGDLGAWQVLRTWYSGIIERGRPEMSDTYIDASYEPTEGDIAAYNADQAKLEAELKAELSIASSKPSPKLPKSVRQSITIYVRGRERRTMEARIVEGCDVYADVLAIHKIPKSMDFKITHVPTGMSIIDYVSPKAKAAECVAALLEDGAEIWRFGSFGVSEGLEENFKIVSRVANKARHVAHPENWNEDGTRVRR